MLTMWSSMTTSAVSPHKDNNKRRPITAISWERNLQHKKRRILVTPPGPHDQKTSKRSRFFILNILTIFWTHCLNIFHRWTVHDDKTFWFTIRTFAKVVHTICNTVIIHVYPSLILGNSSESFMLLVFIDLVIRTVLIKPLPSSNTDTWKTACFTLFLSHSKLHVEFIVEPELKLVEYKRDGFFNQQHS